MYRSGIVSVLWLKHNLSVQGTWILSAIYEFRIWFSGCYRGSEVITFPASELEQIQVVAT